MNIQMLSPDIVSANWFIIEGFLHKALEHGCGESTTTDYLRMILNYDAQCWGVIEDNTIVGVGLTKFIQYNQHKTLHIVVFSGSQFEYQSEMFKHVAEFAKTTGCKSIEQWGRDGWVKVLPKYIPGFKKVYTVMRYDIGDTNEISKS